jgi:hypothetical protein
MARQAWKVHTYHANERRVGVTMLRISSGVARRENFDGAGGARWQKGALSSCDANVIEKFYHARGCIAPSYCGTEVEVMKELGEKSHCETFAQGVSQYRKAH